MGIPAESLKPNLMVEPEAESGHLQYTFNRNEAIDFIKKLSHTFFKKETIIIHLADEDWKKWVNLIKKETDICPEYAHCKLILKGMLSVDMERIMNAFKIDLQDWNNGYSISGIPIITNNGQLRKPDVEWRSRHATGKQMNDIYAPIAMPELWMEICSNRIDDKALAFETIASHIPTTQTLFVVIVLLQKNVSETLQNVKKADPVAQWTQPATEQDNEPVYADPKRDVPYIEESSSL